MTTDPVVVVGAGHSGVSTAIALRDEGFAGDIIVIGDEHHAPYNRPPLSKSYLKGADDVTIREDEFWRDRSIRLVLGRSVAAIDTGAHTIRLDSNETVSYSSLVLATGASARTIPAQAPYDVFRSLDDALAIRKRLVPGSRLCIVGGGFIGLELACAARTQGVEVTLIEAAPRLLTRAVSADMADHLAAAQASNGVRLALGTSVRSILSGQVVLESGECIETDSVVVGIGVTPNVGIAAAAGLSVSDGIVVDEYLATSAADVYAIGDCAQFPCSVSGRPVRLESVQNGTDQAKYVARGIASGTFTEPYRSVPWFWTEQYGNKLMIAGCAQQADRAIVRGTPGNGGFSVCRVDSNGYLTAVESIDSPRDHVAARRLLAASGGTIVVPDLVADPGVPLGEALATV
ncbi:MAG: hypothetical protein EOO27_08515 [Comamonadaceae bacterium]|nr:MAG: hypothetical protein EOO27_08515 [Comamonadaceae bacterium]